MREGGLTARPLRHRPAVGEPSRVWSEQAYHRLRRVKGRSIRVT